MHTILNAPRNFKCFQLIDQFMGSFESILDCGEWNDVLFMFNDFLTEEIFEETGD